MSLRPLGKFCAAHWSMIAAVAAVAMAVATLAVSVDARGASAAASTNFKMFTVAAAVALLVRLVGRKDSEEEGTFSVSGRQGPRELEVTGFTKGE